MISYVQSYLLGYLWPFVNLALGLCRINDEDLEDFLDRVWQHRSVTVLAPYISITTS